MIQQRANVGGYAHNYVRIANMRASGTDETIRLSPIRLMSLEDIIAYIGDDEMMDITPNRIRIRKQELDATTRLRKRKSSKAASG